MANAVQCDRCKSVAVTEEEKNSYIGLRLYIERGMNGYKDFDLCPKCKNALDEFLNGGQSHDVNEV